MLNRPYYTAMATESTADTELSVTLSPRLSEWLEERAATLGVDRETLLVQLLETHREAADLDDDLAMLLSEASADADRERLEEIDSRVDAVDTALSEHVEDLRSRILQLKDAVNSRSPGEHDHPEIDVLAERVTKLSSEFDGVTSELDTLSDDFEATDGHLETLETKLHRLARVVLELKRQSESATESVEPLDRLRRLANESGTTAADCGNCGERIQVALLTEAACPHCAHEFEDIEHPTSILRPFARPKLVASTPELPEAPDE